MHHDYRAIGQASGDERFGRWVHMRRGNRIISIWVFHPLGELRASIAQREWEERFARNERAQRWLPWQLLGAALAFAGLVALAWWLR